MSDDTVYHSVTTHFCVCAWSVSILFSWLCKHHGSLALMKLIRYTIQTQTNCNLDICYTPRVPTFPPSLSHPPFIFRMLPSFHYQLHKVFNTPLTNASSYFRPSYIEVCTAIEEKSHFETSLLSVCVGFNQSTVNELAWKLYSHLRLKMLRGFAIVSQSVQASIVVKYTWVHTLREPWWGLFVCSTLPAEASNLFPVVCFPGM